MIPCLNFLEKTQGIQSPRLLTPSVIYTFEGGFGQNGRIGSTVAPFKCDSADQVDGVMSFIPDPHSGSSQLNPEWLKGLKTRKRALYPMAEPREADE